MRPVFRMVVGEGFAVCHRLIQECSRGSRNSKALTPLLASSALSA